MQKSFRPHVLLIAEAANPEWVSVPLVGWSLANAIREQSNAHFVTQVRNRAAILRAGLIEGKDFTAIDNESIAAPLHKLSNLVRGGVGKGWTTSTAISVFAYYSFESKVWRLFKDRLEDGEFDLVHRITPLTPTSPSIIARRLAKIGVPFVLGPLNGGLPWPKGFIDRQHAEKEWLAHVRGAYRLLPGYGSTRRNAAAIIVGSQQTLHQMPAWCQDQCVYEPENGIDPLRFFARRRRHAKLPLRGIFIGRLVPYKGADILLHAARKALAQKQLELHIVGDGPEKAKLRSIVERNDISGQVTFHGWVEHTEVQELLGSCDFMALPSIREFGGGVVLEAMAVGLAPVVADYGGPGELVDDLVGIKVPFSDPDSLISNFANVIASLVADPARLDQLGKAAKMRVQKTHTWRVKAERIIGIYQRILAAKAGQRRHTAS